MTAIASDEFLSLDEALDMFEDPNRIQSNAEIIAQLSPEDQQYMLDGVDMEAYLYAWSEWGRPKQFVRDDPYYPLHLFLTGRGFIRSVKQEQVLSGSEKKQSNILVAVSFS